MRTWNVKGEDGCIPLYHEAEVLEPIIERELHNSTE